MRIIQSFWSKPFKSEGSVYLNSRSKGGWISSKIFFMSFALSCLRLRKYYDDVHLVTDDIGKKILIDQLALPYASVSTDLETLHDFDEGLWALGKLLTYGRQTEPFLHVDSDFFIWKPFDEALLKAGLIAQSLEIGEQMDYYKVICDQVRKNFKYIPPVADAYVANGGNINGVGGYNAGIFGGTDIQLFKELSDMVFETIRRNDQNLKTINLGLLNIFLEQGLFLCLVEAQKKHVTTLIENVDSNFSQLTDFVSIPRSRFVHAVGKSKQSTFANEQVYLRLHLESDFLFCHINEFCDEFYQF